MYRKFVQDEVLDNGIIKGHMELIKTNADRIRSMTDEELSAFLCNMGQECNQCIATDYCSLGHTGMLDWLKKEVDE